MPIFKNGLQNTHRCLAKNSLSFRRSLRAFLILRNDSILALDKEGFLVIIEHKLDDTGRDVTWQALKYASCCARLTKEELPRLP